MCGVCVKRPPRTGQLPVPTVRFSHSVFSPCVWNGWRGPAPSLRTFAGPRPRARLPACARPDARRFPSPPLPGRLRLTKRLDAGSLCPFPANTGASRSVHLPTTTSSRPVPVDRATVPAEARLHRSSLIPSQSLGEPTLGPTCSLNRFSGTDLTLSRASRGLHMYISSFVWHDLSGAAAAPFHQM